MINARNWSWILFFVECYIIFSSKIFNHLDMTSKICSDMVTWHLNQTDLVMQNCLSEKSLLRTKEQSPAEKQISILGYHSWKMYSKYTLRSAPPCVRQDVGYQSLSTGIQQGQQREDSRDPEMPLISATAMVGWTRLPASWIQRRKQMGKSGTQPAESCLGPPSLHPSPLSNSLTIGVCRSKKDQPISASKPSYEE